jgi:hypothetical protein
MIMDKIYCLIQDINPKEICSHIENGNLAEWCNAWRIAAKEALQPKTNADRIRAMSDEELCEFLGEYKFCDICEEGCDACQYSGDCDKRLLDWLKQPAEE